MPSIDKIRNRINLACLLLLLSVGLALPTYAKEKGTINIVVVLSKNTLPYQQFNRHLQKTITAEEARKITFYLVDSDIVESISVLQKSGVSPDYIVTAGIHAAQKLITTDVLAPSIFSLIPGSSYQDKIQKSPYCIRQTHCSAIYLDQPIDRQFSVIKQSLPDVRRLGIILGSTSAKMQNKILQAGRKYDIDLSIELVDEKSNPVILSDQLSKKNDALLAIPDPDVYNRRTAKGILLSTYKHQAPFIAYSHGFVRAGALFSIYTTPEQIAIQTGHMLVQALDDTKKKLPAPESPIHYKIEVNRAVMRALRAKINFDSSMLENQ